MNGHLQDRSRTDAVDRHAPGLRGLRQAEEVYLDCLSRFGLNSAEAHVARVIWCQLRSRSLGSSPAA